jgi:hypothetical protein
MCPMTRGPHEIRFANGWSRSVVLLLFPLALIRRDRLMIALGVSAIVSELSLFVIAPTADFRYSIWLVIVAFYLLVFAAISLRARRA